MHGWARARLETLGLGVQLESEHGILSELPRHKLRSK
jgi:hypothetical protein